jgi:hypothetical protein
MKFRLLFITLLITFLSNAQKGTVSGVLTDKDMNNEPLPFANALIKGTTIGTTTDIEGKYSLSVDPGNYILELSFLGYQTIEVPITVKAGQNITVNKALTAGDGVMLQDVVVVTSRKKNTEAAIMAEIKEAKQVVSAISAEQMSKGTDSNAADAIQRVPGVTIVDGRFVMIRGLSERYNNVLINNAVAPSTEVDKRTFAFDLIPTRAIDKMLIVKTGSADKPGDFSGGIINITTSENITNFNTFNVGFGYRNNTSFQDYFQSNGSKTDFLGFDYELINSICKVVSVPVICSGGAKNADDFIKVFENTNASAASAANFFHFFEHSVNITKCGIKKKIAVRLETHADYSENEFDENYRLQKKLDSVLEEMLFVRIEKEVI